MGADYQPSCCGKAAKNLIKGNSEGEKSGAAAKHQLGGG